MRNYVLNKFSDGLWQGDAVTAIKLVCTDEYKKHGITAVLCPAYNVDIPYHKDLQVLKLPIDDHDSVDHGMLSLAADFYYLTGRKLFVHCLGGRNRSIAFVVFYLALEGMDFDKALKLAKKQTQSDCPYSELITSMRAWFDKQDKKVTE